MNATDTDDLRSDILSIENKTARSLPLIGLVVGFGLWHVVTNVYLIEPGSLAKRDPFRRLCPSCLHVAQPL